MAKADPEYDALYAAVCAAPLDDTPRLVLADWLDEHDDPHRAAFIRAQVQLARLSETDPHAAAVFSFRRAAGHHDWNHYADAAQISPAVARMAELAKVEKANESKAEARWKSLRGSRAAGRFITTSRGFPHTIAISNARQYARAVAKVPSENLPGYDLFVMSENEDGFDDLLNCGRLAGADGFTLFGINTAESLRKLGRRPEARNFRSLHVSLSQADPALLAPIATEPNWAGLSSLTIHSDIRGSSADLDLPPEFRQAKHLRNLTSLDIGLRGLSGATVAGLARLGLPKLRDLNVHYGSIDSAGAIGVAAGGFPELRDLDIQTNKIGNTGAAALAHSEHLPLLAALNLQSTGITDPGVMSDLIAGPGLPALTGLDLANNRSVELDAKVLAAPGRGPTLRLLSLRHCRLSPTAIAALATTPSLANVVGIDLAGNAIGDAGARALAGAKWDRLTCLDVGSNGIGAEGVKALVGWSGLSKLAFFDIGGDNPIGLEGAQVLSGCKALKKARKIAVPAVVMLLPAEGLRLLEAAFGRRIDRKY